MKKEPARQALFSDSSLALNVMSSATREGYHDGDDNGTDKKPFAGSRSKSRDASGAKKHSYKCDNKEYNCPFNHFDLGPFVFHFFLTLS